jgi:hypothetical protein
MVGFSQNRCPNNIAKLLCSRLWLPWLEEEGRSHQAPGVNPCQNPSLASWPGKLGQVLGEGVARMKWRRQVCISERMG